MNRVSRVALTATFAALLAFTALAQVPPPPDLSGRWTLNATGQLPDENLPCVFEGSGLMSQDGTQLTGQASLMLVSGPAACPAEMMADLTGSLDGSIFTGILDGGDLFGILDFTGQVDPVPAVAVSPLSARTLAGRFTVRPGGPFGGTTGGWSAARILSVLEIPTLTGVGVAALIALLAAASFVLLRRAA